MSLLEVNRTGETQSIQPHSSILKFHKRASHEERYGRQAIVVPSTKSKLPGLSGDYIEAALFENEDGNRFIDNHRDPDLRQSSTHTSVIVLTVAFGSSLVEERAYYVSKIGKLQCFCQSYDYNTQEENGRFVGACEISTYDELLDTIRSIAE